MQYQHIKTLPSSKKFKKQPSSSKSHSHLLLKLIGKVISTLSTWTATDTRPMLQSIMAAHLQTTPSAPTLILERPTVAPPITTNSLRIMREQIWMGFTIRSASEEMMVTARSLLANLQVASLYLKAKARKRTNLTHTTR